MRLILGHRPAVSGKLSSAAQFDALAVQGAFGYPEPPRSAVTVDSGMMMPEQMARVIAGALQLGNNR